ncbi:hypothetical protein [Pseudomonas laurylsulfatiphila]|uniref:hypothetical protein n=1 Tax=Pseudomonas laurylsulfatiphila TaxID=2011015 RepID=UPI003D2290EE
MLSEKKETLPSQSLAIRISYAPARNIQRAGLPEPALDDFPIDGVPGRQAEKVQNTEEQTDAGVEPIQRVLIEEPAVHLHLRTQHADLPTQSGNRQTESKTGNQQPCPAQLGEGPEGWARCRKVPADSDRVEAPFDIKPERLIGDTA